MEEDGLVLQKFFTTQKEEFVCLGNGLTLDQHSLVPGSTCLLLPFENMPVFFFTQLNVSTVHINY